ncbi:unnamed protein product [Prorocentrum cordatum]|nr:unnamed protein product [Polarella glacialis]
MASFCLASACCGVAVEPSQTITECGEVRRCQRRVGAEALPPRADLCGCLASCGERCLGTATSAADEFELRPEELLQEDAAAREARQLREMLTEALGEAVRQCPFCKVACVKQDADDCDHIFCRCGREFCWQCGADREVIFHHGNHHHKPSCPFYTDFAERSPKLVPHCPQCKATGQPCRPPPGTRALRRVGCCGGS